MILGISLACNSRASTLWPEIVFPQPLLFPWQPQTPQLPPTPCNFLPPGLHPVSLPLLKCLFPPKFKWWKLSPFFEPQGKCHLLQGASSDCLNCHCPLLQ